VNPILQNNLVPVFLDSHVPTYNVDVDQLEAAGDFRGIVGPSAAGVYMRSDVDDAFEMAAPAPQSPGEPDEVDRLFTGGR